MKFCKISLLNFVNKSNRNRIQKMENRIESNSEIRELHSLNLYFDKNYSIDRSCYLFVRKLVEVAQSDEQGEESVFAEVGVCGQHPPTPLGIQVFVSRHGLEEGRHESQTLRQVSNPRKLLYRPNVFVLSVESRHRSVLRCFYHRI